MKQQTKSLYRGEIYYADLRPVMGCEQGGIRPVLVLQNNIGNQHSPTVIVSAITSRAKKKLPTHVELGYRKGTNKSLMVLLEQIRTIDRMRIMEYIGKINDVQMRQVDQALKISMGLVE